MNERVLQVSSHNIHVKHFHMLLQIASSLQLLEYVVSCQIKARYTAENCKMLDLIFSLSWKIHVCECMLWGMGEGNKIIMEAD